MEQFVRNAQGAKPGVRVLVANVVHRGPLPGFPELPTTISTYNTLLPQAIFRLDPSGQKVEMVNLDSNYNYLSDTYDDLHPNGVGEYKIARQFSRGLYLWGLISSQIGGIPSQVADPPLASPNSLRAKVVPNGIELSWQRIFGASGYWIYQRDTTPGLGGKWSRAAFPIPSTTWRVGWLQDGHTYEFEVGAARGRYMSMLSPKAAAKADLKTAKPPTVREVRFLGANAFWWGQRECLGLPAFLA
jgi:hypothetical protein